MAFDKLSIEDTEVDELAPGTSLCHGKYVVERFLNSGGFGITYLARDSEGRAVVLKECFVPAFCRREGTVLVARTEDCKPQLQMAIRGFLAEAEILAAVSHPNIVRVRQAFRDNGTAYMALDHIEGHDLLDVIYDNPAELAPDRIVALTRKLVDALAHVHERRFLHCDISPDNIRLRSDGEPILLDFGSARKNGGAANSGFSMVKDGYSPPELYTPDARCGPFTDIYALGASLYHAVSGTVPADCQRRMSADLGGHPDPVRPLAGSVAGYPPGFLAGIDRAMSVSAAQRFQNARDWLRLIAVPAPGPRMLPLPIRAIVAPAPFDKLHVGV